MRQAVIQSEFPYCLHRENYKGSLCQGSLSICVKHTQLCTLKSSLVVPLEEPLTLKILLLSSSHQRLACNNQMGSNLLISLVLNRI